MTWKVRIGIASVITLVLGVVVLMVVNDIRSDRRMIVRITAAAKLLAEPSPSDPTSRVVGTVSPNEKVQVRRIRYGKDFMSVKVRTENGLEGWLIFGESPFEILPASDAEASSGYPFEHIAAIISLFALPAVGTIAFLLTGFSRNRRVLPWLLAPVVYVVVAFVCVVLAVNFGYMEP